MRQNKTVAGFSNSKLVGGLATASFIAALLHCAHAEAQVTLVSTGAFAAPGGSDSRVYALANRGDVAVGFSAVMNGRVATRWTPFGGLQSLGSLPDALRMEASDTDGLGQHVVGFVEDESGVRAFQWTAQTGLVQLGVPTGGDFSVANAINSDGTVIVGGFGTGDGGGLPFRWTASNGFETYAPLPDTSASTAVDVADDGNILVGTSTFSTTSSVAVLWTTPLQPVALGTLNPQATNGESIAEAISGDGLTVVGTSTTSDGWRAFRWTSSGGMQNLGSLETGVVSWARDTSFDGSRIVGQSSTSGYFGQRAFLWTQSTGMVDLALYLNSIGVSTQGWLLVDALCISRDGTAIGGWGYLNGLYRGWVIRGLPPSVTCDSIDFNNDTSLFDPQDIEAYFSVYSEGPCIPADATCNDIDFNNDTSLFDPCDINSFLLMYSEGPCTTCGV